MPEVVVKESNGHESTFKGIDKILVESDHSLILKRCGAEQKRVVPVKIFWGLLEFERVVDETVDVPVARFMSWHAYWVDGVKHTA